MLSLGYMSIAQISLKYFIESVAENLLNTLPYAQYSRMSVSISCNDDNLSPDKYGVV